MKKSVVIRGSISYDNHPKNFLENILENILSWFDGEIILSTWEGQEKFISKNVENKIHKIIFSKDPGEVDNFKLKHFKRQVLSYSRGFSESTGDLVLVTRPDIIFKKDPFKFIDRYSFSTDKLKVFSNKLIVSNMMTIRPDSDEFPNCFRVCDWYQIGYRDDIEKWSDILDIAMDLDSRKMTDMNCTETIWFLSVLKNKFGNIVDIYNPSLEIKSFAWEAIVNNFIVMDTRTSLEAHNVNWNFQPEYCSCYFDEKLYEKLYNSILNDRI
jgi:hypothetical protein